MEPDLAAALAWLARVAGTGKEAAAAAAAVELLETRAREIAREEVASLAGLILRRLQDSSKRGWNPDAALEGAFAEALRDFGGTDSEPGK